MGTAKTLTTDMVGVVNEIRLRSMKVIAAEGVMKGLVHNFGRGDGYQISEPTWDYSSYSGTARTETQDLSSSHRTSLSTTRRIYTATEWTFYTTETYAAADEASESMRQFHADAHGHSHAERIEVLGLKTFASFTTHTVAATASTGLTFGKVGAARTKLEMSQTPAPKPYSLVVNPNVWYYYVQNQAQNSTYGPVGTVAGELLNKYRLGSIMGGIDVFYTPYDVDNDNSGLVVTNASSYCSLFARPAIGLFMPRDFRLEAQKEVLKRGYDIVSSFKAGFRVRNVGWGVLIKATGTTPS
jgi:hypothetical protein